MLLSPYIVETEIFLKFKKKVQIPIISLPITSTGSYCT